MAKSYPSPFCIHCSHSLGIDIAVQSHKPWESSFGLGQGQLPEVFSRRSPWALPVHPHQLLGT